MVSVEWKFNQRQDNMNNVDIDVRLLEIKKKRVLILKLQN